MDHITKLAHFLAVRMTFSLEEFYRLYIREIDWLHGVPVSIVSDKDPRFTAHFWNSFQKAMETQLTMSTTFYPQTDGQSERTIQILEDMLRACVIDLKGSWEEHLPLVEFTTIIVIRKVLRWHPMRPYIEGHVNHRSDGQRWESTPSLV